MAEFSWSHAYLYATYVIFDPCIKLSGCRQPIKPSNATYLRTHPSLHPGFLWLSHLYLCSLIPSRCGLL